MSSLKSSPRVVAFMLLGVLSFGCVVASEFILTKMYEKTGTGSITMPSEKIVVHGRPRSIIYNEHLPNTEKMAFPGIIDVPSFYENRGYRLRFDQNGFLVGSTVYSDPDLKLMFFGGSTIEDRYIDEDERAAAKSAQLLGERTGLKVNAYNAGVSGTNSYNSLIGVLTKGVPQRPDYLFLLHNVNDLIQLIYYGDIWLSPDGGGRWKEAPPIETTGPKRIFRAFVVLFDELIPRIMHELRMVRDKVYNKTPAQLDKKEESVWWAASPPVIDKTRLEGKAVIAKFRAQLEVFIHISRAYGIRPVLMTQANRLTKNIEDPVLEKLLSPLFDAGVSYNKFKYLSNSLNAEIRSLAIQYNVLLVDLEKTIPKKNEYLWDLVHSTEKGAALVASEIASVIEKDIANR